MHDTEAARLADAYVSGDAEARAAIGRYCEDRGVLAALLVVRLRPHGLDAEFIGAMKRSAEQARGR